MVGYDGMGSRMGYGGIACSVGYGGMRRHGTDREGVERDRINQDGCMLERDKLCRKCGMQVWDLAKSALTEWFAHAQNRQE